MFYNEKNRAYQILEAYHVVRPATHRIHIRWRDHASLAYQIRGNTQYLCSGRELYAAAGNVIYIPSFTDYRISCSETELMIIHLHCFGQDEKMIEIHDAAKNTAGLFRELLQTWDSSNTGCQHGATAILHRILETLQKTDDKTGTRIGEELLPAVLFLRENFRDPTLRIPDLAKKCHISEVYFRKLYKKAFGISPQEALLDMRFRYARSLLRSGYYPVKQAAELSGFTDTKYFRTAFGKRFGITPSAYTALHTSEDRI